MTLPRALSVELRLQDGALDVRGQFRVAPGRVCALLGHAHAGHRTLARATAGLAPALSGRVALGGQALYDSAAGISLRASQRGLPWLDGSLRAPGWLRVRHHLLLTRTGSHRPWRAHPQWDELVQCLGLEGLLGRRCAELNAAQRVRVGLAKALLSAPQALCLDDPLDAVAAPDRAPLLDLLADWPRRFKLPVLLLSPRVREVVRLADEVVLMHEGRVVSAGPTAAILSDASLSTFLEGEDAGCVLEGSVAHHDLHWLLSEVDVQGQRITVPALPHPIGSSVRIRLRARDLSLHRQPPSDTSSSNHLRGRIARIALAGAHGSHGAVCLDLEAPALPSAPVRTDSPTAWALLTRRAIEEGQWAPGQDCVVGFKAHAAVVSLWR